MAIAGLNGDAFLAEGGDADQDDGTAKPSNSRVARLRIALFETARELTRKSGMPAPVLVFLWVFELLQMLVFPLSPAASMPWASSPMMHSWFKLQLPLVLVPGTNNDIVTYSTQGLFIAAAVGASLCSLGLLWMVHANLGYSAYKPSWRARAVSTLILLGLYGFFSIPGITSLLAPFACAKAGGPWLDTDVTCMSDAHIGYLAGAVLVTPLFLALQVGGSLLLVNRVPDPKTNVLCQTATGRPFAAINTVKLFLGAFFVLANGAAPSLSGWAHGEWLPCQCIRLHLKKT